MAVEIEDDVFFADLSRQIAMLITDDDEEEFPVQSPPVHVQSFHQNMMPQAILMPPPYTYEMAYRRVISKGTGVFIPRSSLPRRKNNRSGKSNSNNTQRQYDKSGQTLSRAAANNDKMLNPANHHSNSGSLKNFV